MCKGANFDGSRLARNSRRAADPSLDFDFNVNPMRTSPVKRGKWVLENLLGAPLPAPPADVPELADEKQGQLVGTPRERLEQHRSDSKCSVCHNHIDPLGFAVENYDAIGVCDTRDGEGPIDASGSLPDGTSFKGPAELKQRLVSRRDELTRRCRRKNADIRDWSWSDACGPKRGR